MRSNSRLLTLPRFHINPYPELARLRALAPVHAIEEADGVRFWLVTRFAEASAVLKDRRFSPRQPGSERAAGVELSSAVQQMIGRSMVVMDPPAHTRLRGLVSQAFTPRFVEALRPRVQQLTEALLDAAAPRGGMEFINDFAYPLPLGVIAELLGVPPGDRDRLRGWSQVLFESMTPRLHADPQRDARAREYIDAMRALIDTRRREPGEDLITQLVRAEEQGSRLDEHEFLSMLSLLIFAGHETTVNLLGSGLLALLTQPEALARLQREPALIPSAVEELLRLWGPVTHAPRYALEDLELGGERIRAGELVMVSLASANRDERHVPDPETLDVAREGTRHLAFGLGIHFCLGAQLARLEAQVAFTTLLLRLPGLRLAVAPEAVRWRANMFFRGPQALPVAF